MSGLMIFHLLISFYFLSISPSLAEIKTLSISSDSRPMILFEEFGFSHTGTVLISVDSINVSRPTGKVDPSFLGFFLLSKESLIQLLVEIQQNPQLCVLQSSSINLLFTFSDLSLPTQNSYNGSFAVNSPNEYSLFFANCEPDSSVSMEFHTELYNVDSDGSKDYLSVGLTQLPPIFFVFSLCYLAFLGLWIYVCYTNKRSFHRIHLLMAVLLLMKALNLFCAAEEKHYIKVTGAPHGWDVLFYIFQFIRVVLLFTVIVLIGTGWSFLKPFLQKKEKKVLMIVIPLQVLANVASVVIGKTGPFMKDWVTWNQVFLLADIICCCAILFPIVWSIRSLRKKSKTEVFLLVDIICCCAVLFPIVWSTRSSVETSKTDSKAARNLANLALFRQFYVVVIGYLFSTRIGVFALQTIVAYQCRWVSNAAEEIASLAFYAVMFYMFRPVEKNENFVLDEEEEEAAEMPLKDEEFRFEVGKGTF